MWERVRINETDCVLCMTLRILTVNHKFAILKVTNKLLPLELLLIESNMSHTCCDGIIFNYCLVLIEDKVREETGIIHE